MLRTLGRLSVRLAGLAVRLGHEKAASVGGLDINLQTVAKMYESVRMGVKLTPSIECF